MESGVGGRRTEVGGEPEGDGSGRTGAGSWGSSRAGDAASGAESRGHCRQGARALWQRGFADQEAPGARQGFVNHTRGMLAQVHAILGIRAPAARRARPQGPRAGDGDGGIGGRRTEVGGEPGGDRGIGTDRAGSWGSSRAGDAAAWAEKLGGWQGLGRSGSGDLRIKNEASGNAWLTTRAA